MPNNKKGRQRQGGNKAKKNSGMVDDNQPGSSRNSGSKGGNSNSKSGNSNSGGNSGKSGSNGAR